jgi:hypothetical protein
VVVAGELHCLISSEAVRALHDDRTDAIPGNTVQHSGEAGTLCNRICTSHSLVVEPIDDDEAGRLGVTLNCLALARFAVLAFSDVGRGAGAHVSDGFDGFPSSGHDLKSFSSPRPVKGRLPSLSEGVVRHSDQNL